MRRILGDAARRREAAAEFQPAVRIKEELVKQDPTSSKYRRSLAVSLGLLGNMLQELGSDERAREVLRSALAIWHDLPTEVSEQPDAQHRLGNCHNLLGIALA